MTDPFASMRLRCTNCRGKVPGRRLTAYRKPNDPASVCRCSRCGKKHSLDSLEVVR